MPDATEVHRLVRELRHGDDLGVAVDSRYEGVLHRRADTAGGGEEPIAVERLAAEEDDEVREPRLTDLSDDVVLEVLGQVDTADLRAQGSLRSA